MAEIAGIFSAAEIASWTGSVLIGDGEIPVLSAEVDSRRCSGGCLFFALQGDRADGHDFIDTAFENGACGAVVSSGWHRRHRTVDPGVGRFLLVADKPLAALQKAAAEYMKGIDRPVRIGITGSNGKTTTKELVAGVLAEKYSVVKTAGNYNSEIGLPLTVFNIKNQHEYAVIEMGVNRVGEMDVLTEILRPDVVVITNIGTAHIGIFENIETIAFEKRRSTSLFGGEGTLFINEDEEFAGFLTDGLKGRAVRFGKKSLESQKGELGIEDLGLRGWKFRLGSSEVDFPLVGAHNLENAFCAAAVGIYAGLGDEEIASGLKKAEPLFGRSLIIEGPVTIIQDSYNANPDSLHESIMFADNLGWEGSKIYVIGDMKELGRDSGEMHRKAGISAAGSAADKVLFFGEDSRIAYETALESEFGAGTDRPVLFHTVDYGRLEDELLDSLSDGDLVLLKGSRTMNLERLVNPVKEKFRGAEC